VERNLFRTAGAGRRARHGRGAPARAAARGDRGDPRRRAFTLSSPIGLPAAVRRVLGEAGRHRVRGERRGVDPAVHGAGGDARRSDLLPSQKLPESLTESGEGAAEARRNPLWRVRRRPNRVRIVGAADDVAALHAARAEAVQGSDLAIFAGEVTTAGRIELLPFLHEQAIAITAHRYGNPDDWSAGVI
jgi:RHH-type proline utilization regulon transcriptional repressor/proline dehydrogenase/delta 1-pyrroline-5-carboxylate dehydrogenase